MQQKFHLPNPDHEGTPLEGTFSHCNDDDCDNEHQTIDVVGRHGRATFSCEHKSHTLIWHKFTPLNDPSLEDARTCKEGCSMKAEGDPHPLGTKN